jgi:CHAT domain-containing protein
MTAQSCYFKADSLRAATLPPDHPLRSIADYHLSKIQFHNYSANKELVEEAYETAERSLEGLSNDPQMQYLDHGEYLRNAAYIWKIKHGFHLKELGMNYQAAAIPVRPKYQAALLTAQKQFGQRSYTYANVLHNLGNTFTDVFGFTNDQDSALGRVVLDSALHYYDSSLELREQLGLGLSERSVMTWFTKGIVLRSIWDEALTESSTVAFLKGIDLEHELLDQFGGTRNFRTVNNPSQTLEIYNLLFTNLLITYIKTGRISLLEEALPHREQAEKIWKELLIENQTHFLHDVVGLYGREPFTLTLDIMISLYQETPSPELALDILTTIEKRKQAQTNRWALEIPEVDQQLRSRVQKTLRAIDNEHASLYHLHMGSQQIFLVVWDKGELFVDQVNKQEYRSEFYGLHSLYADFTAQLKQRDISLIKESSTRLHNLLVDPVKDNLQCKIYDLPQSLYSWFTLDYLYDGSSYFIEDHLVHQLSSLSAYGQGELSDRPVELAVVPYEQDLLLPHTTACLKELGKTGDIFRELQTRSELNALFREGGCVHLAGHAFADPAKPRSSGLILPHDTVFMQELLILPPTDFVFLHACETATGYATRFNNNLSLSWAFTQVGTRSQVVSLWPIDDQASAQLTTAFYSNWDEGMTQSEALWKAKKDFLTRHKGTLYESPFYWAGLSSLDNEMRRVKTKGHHWGWAWCLVLLPLYFVYQRIRQ